MVSRGWMYMCAYIYIICFNFDILVRNTDGDASCAQSVLGALYYRPYHTSGHLLCAVRGDAAGLRAVVLRRRPTGPTRAMVSHVPERR
jgi:hypothetical protein